MHDSFKALMPLIIPEGVSDYFEMTHYSNFVHDPLLGVFLKVMVRFKIKKPANTMICRLFRSFFELF
ncbi:hypothetical protein [Sphingobacterium cavernae]|uniref:hypothetical protein n=1 Tax=Sphingobacterium cavernae TaxID=2592657 RepID=UPI0012301413|nr:hypothetical protein [Sphingobacterium cavernae]